MRTCAFALAMVATLASATAFADGPQIQITNDGGKIVTRELLLDEPYGDSLSTTKSVYVMPLLQFNNVWYSRPNDEIDPILGVPAFPAGPGLAYGYDLADGGPQLFEAGSVLSLGFVNGLKRWDGAMFADAGSTQLKAFRGTNASISSPPENFAVTTDSGPFDSLNSAAVPANYGSDGTDAHILIRFALLGDGIDPLSASPDGVYLLSMRLASTQSGLAPSQPFYFVLHKNAATEAIVEAVDSLGVAASDVQWLAVPEPSLGGLAASASAVLICVRVRRRKNG